MPDTDEPEDNTETVFMPSRPPTSGSAPEPAPVALAAAIPVDPPAVLGRVSIGDVLNGIYEVKRVIARGGMGEVYEGVNINSDERVAIKVMLPSLASDAKVQAMFRKEARTLTKLAHPAVVQYRVLAHEPRLNVLYIVTEFVDGVELTAVLGQIHPTSAELKSLIRRLADGLRAAHELGAVHRDISPDNVLLPDRRLDRARIIDFGIAKDLDPTKATIVGDGFAGKLAYVAPEQFGDFGREIGPWTDIYSLGLVIMAVATGKDVDMGSTLVEAVDKRRQGIDLGALPDDLRPILERMLMADPAKRARSMDEVLGMLDDQGRTTFPPTTSIPPTTIFPPAAPIASTPSIPPAATVPPTASIPPTTLRPAETTTPPATAFPTATSTPPTTYPPATTPPITSFPATTIPPIAAGAVPPIGPATIPPHATTYPPMAVARAAAPGRKGPPLALVLGGVAAFVVIGAGVVYVMLPKGPKTVAASAGPAAPVVAAAPTTTADQAISATLPDLPCSWLDVVGPVQTGQPVKLSGAAGSLAMVQDTVLSAAKGARDNLAPSGVDLSAVAQADQGACTALDAFRSFKAPGGAGPALASAQPAYQITRGADGKLAGQPTITVAPRSPGQDFALLRMDANGRISMVYPGRKAFDAARQGDSSITDQGGDAYTVQADALNVAGAAGLLLLTGTGPFDPALLAKPPGARDLAWVDQVRQAGSAGGWKSSMVWYKVQNNAPLAKAKVRASYYAHPGTNATAPAETPQAPVQTAPPAPGKKSVWQRLFGSSGHSDPSR
jgi:serine/threonine protein kinase